MKNDLAEGIYRINQRIAESAQRSARLPGSVRLMAASKTQPAEIIGEVLAAGHRLFGENRVQEASVKFPVLKEVCPDLELHLIGPLQTNKAGQAVALFDAIQTLDRPALAAVLAKEMAKQGRKPRLFVQVNIGYEPQKSGVLPEEAPAFVAQCRQNWDLEIEGLMAIPPRGVEPMPFFKQMQRLAAEVGVRELSLGMSADFEQAIEAGSTLVRVGAGLFGARKKPQEAC